MNKFVLAIVLAQFCVLEECHGLTCRHGFASPSKGAISLVNRTCPSYPTNPVCLAAKGTIAEGLVGVEFFTCHGNTDCTSQTCSALLEFFQRNDTRLNGDNIFSCEAIKCCNDELCNDMRYDQVVPPKQFKITTTTTTNPITTTTGDATKINFNLFSLFTICFIVLAFLL